MSDHEIVALVHTTRMYFFKLTLFSRHYFLWQVVVATWYHLVYLFSKRPLSRNEQHEPHAVLFHARLHHPQQRFAEVPSFQEHGAAQSAIRKRGDHLPGFSALASDGVS